MDLSAESGKFKPRNLLNAGISLIQQAAAVAQAAVRNPADSSDDETTDQNEDENYILKGTRGIQVFPILSVRTGKRKVIHVNLYKSQIIQYSADSKKRVFQCSDIVNLIRTSEKNVSVEFRGVIEMQNKTKKFSFETETSAERFFQYVEFIIELGKGIRQSFNQIDTTRKGKILSEDLQAALARVDLPSDTGTVDTM
jgi:predicted HTH transcriptional regulator